MAKKNHHLTQRGKHWYFTGMVKGKRYYFSLSTSLTEARKIRDEYLVEIKAFGEIQSIKQTDSLNEGSLFGEVSLQWIEHASMRIKSSTLKDYKSAMNTYILPVFGNTPIRNINYLDITKFISSLKCSAKRINNILVPMRSVMSFALKAELIDKNPLTLVENLKTEKPEIYPLSMEEVKEFLGVVNPFYKDFFIIAFYTGMRFGEMAALKWKNVRFDLGVIQVTETRVRGEEGRPKTNGSIRDIQLLPPVFTSLISQRKKTYSTPSSYVFLNKNNVPLLPNSILNHTWKPALEKAGLRPRSLYQTRHTFATLMLDSGETPGWVQSMMGHNSLKMILEHYYSYIKAYKRNEGSSFMENTYLPIMKE